MKEKKHYIIHWIDQANDDWENVLHILSKTPVLTSDEQSEFILELNRFQLEGRYPEYVSSIYKLCNKSFTNEMIDKAKAFKTWMEKKLQ